MSGEHTCVKGLKGLTCKCWIIIVPFCFLLQCQDRPEPLFRSLGSEITGIEFSNTVTYSDTLSVLDFEYMYNGGGVSVGDINNDGLLDIYFTGNMVSSRLYLNKGNFKFEDITEKAKVGTNRWANGSAMVDINQDGFADIYVCMGGNRNTPEKERTNVLFINNQDGTFTESAKNYGLDDTGFAIQSAFLDYDRDGDLDMYLLRNSYVDYHRNASRPKLINGEAYSTDRLFRNNGDLTFTDVSREAGILIEGFGLGVEVADVNDDGWPDVYVSNDFITNDLLYINNQDGTFTNKIRQYLKHQTFNGMGTDLADYNNDGKVDIFVLDMLPEDNKRWKLTPRGNTFDEFQNGIRNGYEPQYIRNTLQLNNGNNTFSEIGQLAGVEATEWSWSALFGDYDNDGLKDLFITNGYGKDITNLDFIVYGDKNQSMGLDEASAQERQKLLNELPGIKVPNYIYRNKGDLTFSDETVSWGMADPTFSNGAAYADLDNDGDLDLVISNIDGKASVMECREQQRKAPSNYLRISLDGPPQNREGFGTKVSIRHNGSLQYQYYTVVRGYLSSVEPFIHFGLGPRPVADSLEIVWPDGKYQLIKDVKANQVLKIDYRAATEASPKQPVSTRQPLLTEVTGECGISYVHRENHFVDFKMQPILPHMHSRNGPGIAVGDVDGNGLEDFYVGGGADATGALFIHGQNGKFQIKRIPALDSLSEELGVLFFDADNDQDLDLYSVSGSSEHKKNSELYRDHLYLNDGSGEFQPAHHALPDMRQSKSCIVAGDYDRDGDLDLFVGGRVAPGEYPMAVRSFLLRNDTKGKEVRFTDVTAAILGTENPGMVSAALWTDFDNDGWQDLLMTGEFMPLQFFHNDRGKLIAEAGSNGLAHTSGWWNSLAGGDFDSDGDTDYVAGNLGLNSHFRATQEEPLCIHASDYNKDGRVDPVMSYYVQGEKYVGHPRDILIDQINSIRARFKTYSHYANATFEESFLPEELEGAYVVCAERFESSYVENLGDGKFRITALPLRAQFAPVYGILPGDYNLDGNLDILIAGNSYAPEIISGRDDASIGLYLMGNGKGGFTPVNVTESGFMADNDTKGMAKIICGDGKELILIGNNAEQVTVYSTTAKSTHFKPQNGDAYAFLTLSNGKVIKQEFYYGSTYLSHSSRAIQLPGNVRSLKVFDLVGKSRDLALDGVNVSR